MAIKKIDPAATFKVISQFDDALVSETPEELKTGEKDAEGKDILKSSRYTQYVEADFDESKLVFKEGDQPDRFIVRCLNHAEQGLVNQKYLEVDVVNKRHGYKNQAQMWLEVFKMACTGVESGGKVEKINADELPYHITVEIGSIISLLTTLNKNEKKS